MNGVSRYQKWDLGLLGRGVTMRVSLVRGKGWRVEECGKGGSG